MLQFLYVLLFYGPMSVRKAANMISQYTGESAETVRTALNRCLQKLDELRLTKKVSEWERDITPFALYFLANFNPSKYFIYAVVQAAERRYPSLFKGFLQLLFLCRHEDALVVNGDTYSSDGYIDVKLDFQGGLPEPRLNPRLGNILNNVLLYYSLFKSAGGGRLIDLKSADIKTLLVKDLSATRIYGEPEENVEEEVKCLAEGKCPCVEGLMCSLLDKFDKQALERYYGIRLDTPEAHYLFKLFEELYRDYISGCDEKVLLGFAASLHELGALTQSAVSRKVEFYLHISHRIADVLRIYVERVVRNPFLASLEPIEIEEIGRSLKEALDYLNVVKSRVEKKNSRD